MDNDLQLNSFIIDEESIDNVNLYAYKLPQQLRNIIENVCREKDNSLSNTAIYKLVTSLFDEIIHCNNTIGDINKDENRWIYSLKILDIEFLKEKVSDWLFEEAKYKNISIDNIEFEDKWEYEVINLREILQKKHRNVFSLIPKYYIYKLSKCDFVYNSLNQKLRFYRVVGETDTAEMFTLPEDLSVNNINKKRKYKDMLSYVISAKLKVPIDIDKYVLNISLKTRIWNTYPILNIKIENGSKEFRSALKNDEATSIYVYKKNQFYNTDIIAFNKIRVKRKGSDSYTYKYASDNLFTKIIDIDMEKVLHNQLEYINLNNEQQVIALAIKDNTENKDVEYGAGLPERIETIKIVDEILTELKLREPIKFLRNSGKKKLYKFKTSEAKEYGGEKYIPKKLNKYNELVDGSKELSKKPYKLNTHNKIILNICTRKEEMVKMIITASRILLRLENCEGDNLYSNSDNLKVEFKIIDNRFADCLKKDETSEARMNKIKNIFTYDNENLQCAIIDIPRYDLNKLEKDRDSKYIVRNALKECNIISQFMNFINDDENDQEYDDNNKKGKKSNPTTIDTVLSTVKDLISACGFVEGDLYGHSDIEDEDILLGIGKVSTSNNETRVAISKIESGIIYYKMYPQEKWHEAKEFIYRINKKTLNETNIKINYKNRGCKLNDINDWILDTIDQVLSEKKTTYCFADCNLRNFWSVLRNNDFLKFDNIDVANKKYLRLVRFNTGDELPDYFVYDEKKDNINRKTGIFRSSNSTYYLIGEKHDGNQIENNVTKLEKIKKPIKRQTLCEINIQGADSENERDHVALVTQRLRSMNISYKRDSSQPFPIYCLNRIGEYMISIMKTEQ